MSTLTAKLDLLEPQLIDRLRKCSFLTRCRAGTVSLDELKLFLVQQGLYSAYFTRYLCALMANLPDKAQVHDLAENLCEEMGLTGDSKIPHTVIYKDMLTYFGLTTDGAKPLPGTRRLIDTMFDHCRDRRVTRGLGALCLGGEALVAPMYTDLVAGFEAAGVPTERLTFFHLHMDCDDDHAITMWRIVKDLVRYDELEEIVVEAAGEALVEARIDFFNWIERSYKAAQ